MDKKQENLNYGYPARDHTIMNTQLESTKLWIPSKKSSNYGYPARNHQIIDTQHEIVQL